MTHRRTSPLLEGDIHGGQGCGLRIELAGNITLTNGRLHQSSLLLPLTLTGDGYAHAGRRPADDTLDGGWQRHAGPQ